MAGKARKVVKVRDLLEAVDKLDLAAQRYAARTQFTPERSEKIIAEYHEALANIHNMIQGE